MVVTAVPLENDQICGSEIFASHFGIDDRFASDGISADGEEFSSQSS